MIGSFLRKAQLTGGCAATSAPPVPEDLQLAVPGLILPTLADMTWSSGTGPGDPATSYVLEASDDSFSTVAASVTTTSTSATLTGLTENVYYDFRVKAVNCFGDSAYHDAMSGETTPLKTPTGPGSAAGLGATVSGTTITLDWDDESSAETGYQIERSTNGVSWSLIHTTAAGVETYADTGLAAGTYYYRVRAYDSVSTNSSAWLVQTGSSTVSGGLSPSWSLDFSSGTPSGYTLTRASSGTYVDSSGYIASASTDIARLAHNSSGSRLGLLVEESRTNTLLNSKNLSSWVLDGTTRTTNSATSPENLTEATRFAETSATSGHGAYVATSSQPANCCLSAYAKAAERSCLSLSLYTANNNWTNCVFDLSAGTAGSINNGSSSSWTGQIANIEAVGNGWYRCSIRGTRTSGSTTTPAFGIHTSATPTLQGSNGAEVYAGNTANGVLLWQVQLEEVNRAATAPIFTTTASVTRSADLVHVLDSAITSWGDPGALVVYFYPPGQAGTLISTDDASTAQVGIEASTTTAARAFWSSGSTSTGTIGSGVQKAVHYWNGSTSKFCINGGTVQSGTNNLTIGNTDFVTLGAEATDSSGVPGTFSQYANCVIRKVEFYSGTLTDANLQTITT